MGQCWPLQMPPSAKAVLMSLADQANDAGVCWPAVGTICKRTCLSERAVQRAIQWLGSMGVLMLNRTQGRATNYQINPAGYTGGADLFTAPARAAPPSERHPRQDDTPPPQMRHPTPVALTGDPRKSGTQNQEKRQKKEKNEKFDAGAIELPLWLDAALWLRWVKDRKARHKPITEEGARLQVEQLGAYRTEGFSPKLVIEHSIAGGYAGLFTPKKRDVPTGADPNAPWYDSGTGIKAKAIEIGFEAWTGELDTKGHVEPHPHYLARLRAAVDAREGQPA